MLAGEHVNDCQFCMGEANVPFTWANSGVNVALLFMIYEIYSAKCSQICMWQMVKSVHKNHATVIHPEFISQ